jgi:hypothetical protein
MGAAPVRLLMVVRGRRAMLVIFPGAVLVPGQVLVVPIFTIVSPFAALAVVIPVPIAGAVMITIAVVPRLVITILIVTISVSVSVLIPVVIPLGFVVAAAGTLPIAAIVGQVAAKLGAVTGQALLIVPEASPIPGNLPTILALIPNPALRGFQPCVFSFAE